MGNQINQTPDLPVNWKRNAGFFIGGQFISSFGSILVSHAVTWSITIKEQSGGLIALFTCAALLPMVFIAPFSGVWADRFNRKKLINIADSVIALITLLVAIFYRDGAASMGLLLTAVAARSIGQGVQQPAVSAMIPQIVPAEQLNRFNGIQGTAQSLTMFAAPMAALALLNVLPLQYIFLVDVITAIIGISTVFFFVKVPSVSGTAENPTDVPAKAANYYHELKEGIKFITSNSWLKVLFISSALFLIMASPAAMLTPLQVTRSFGDDLWRLNAIEIAFSAGMILGGIVMSIWGGFKNKTHTMILAWLLFGLSSVLFGIIPNFMIYIGIMVFCGLTMPIYNTPSMTIMQLHVPPLLMGRVFSVMSIIGGLAMPFGMLIFGPLSDVIEIERILFVTGIILAAGGLILLRSRELVRIGGVDISQLSGDKPDEAFKLLNNKEQSSTGRQ